MDPVINLANVSTGTPVDGGCCYTSFEENPAVITSATRALTGYESLGELSPNAFTEMPEHKTTEHDGWHGVTVLVSHDKSSFKVKVEFIEVLRDTVAKLRYGTGSVAGVTGDDDAMNIAIGGLSDAIVPLVFDELMADGRLCRTYFPKCSIVNVDDVPHRRDNLLVYGMTFSVVADGYGQFGYKFYAKPAAPAQSGTGN